MTKGRADLIYRRHDRKVVLVDWKTGVYLPEYHADQLVSYYSMLKSWLGECVEDAILYFVKDCMSVSIKQIHR